jgi:hypothetical protein
MSQNQSKSKKYVRYEDLSKDELIKMLMRLNKRLTRIQSELRAVINILYYGTPESDATQVVPVVVIRVGQAVGTRVSTLVILVISMVGGIRGRLPSPRRVGRNQWRRKRKWRKSPSQRRNRPRLRLRPSPRRGVHNPTPTPNPIP